MFKLKKITNEVFDYEYEIVIQNQSYPKFYWDGVTFYEIHFNIAYLVLASEYLTDASEPFWNHNIVGYPLIPFCWQTD